MHWSKFALLLLTFNFCFIAIKPRFLFVAQRKETQSCLHNSQCIGFTTLLQNSSMYLTSNLTLQFHPGPYSMETTRLKPKEYQITIRRLRNVTIRSNTEISTLRAKMICTKEFKITWSIKYSKNIKIRDIEMIECSGLVILPTSLKKALQGIEYVNFTTTMQVIETINITLINIYAYSINHSAVFYINTGEILCIKNSKFQGSIYIYFSSSFISVRPTKIHVTDSTIYSGVYFYGKIRTHKGLIILIKTLKLSAEIKISHCFFQGIKKTFGYSLDISNGEQYNCPKLTSQICNSHFKHGAVLISGCLDGFPQKVYIDNCTVKKVPDNTVFGLSKVVFEISNTVFLRSDEGLLISGGSLGKIRGCTFNQCKDALEVTDSTAIIQGSNYFHKNFYGEFSAMLFQNSFVYFGGYTVIKNTKGEKYAALSSSNTTMYIQGEVHFVGNEGFYGGAVYLHKDSVIHLLNTATLVFIDNHAWKSGGAIFVDTESYKIYAEDFEQKYQSFSKCFFNSSLESNGSIYFCNNTSVEGGHSIYGGSIDHCIFNPTSPVHGGYYKGLSAQLFRYIATFCDNTAAYLQISSLPYYLCFCDHMNTTCNQIQQNISMVPGQTIKVSILAVGQLEGTALATAQARLMVPPYAEKSRKHRPYILRSQARQLLELSCNQIQYTVHAPVGTETLILSTKELAEEDVHKNLAEYRNSKHKRVEFRRFTSEIPLLIHIALHPCSLGYIYNTETLSCECHPYIVNTEIKCVLNNQTIIRSGTNWVNVTNRTFIMHKFCPMRYCRTQSTELSLTDPSAQCSFNRTGTLCGQCKGNYSQMLGSFDCQECSNLWILLIVPLTLLSGVLLVIFLMTLNLTVASGTLNGLIFYANIIRANNAIFFNTNTSTITRICDVFIAWINLDLGFEVCFHQGLDSYTKTLYQLAFPLYICILVAVIIVSSHYSTRAARLSGTNAVQVLATLFLLSYTKSIRRWQCGLLARQTHCPVSDRDIHTCCCLIPIHSYSHFHSVLAEEVPPQRAILGVEVEASL